MEVLKFMNIEGMTITLVNQVENGTDEFNRPIYEDAEPIEVENVLVGQPSADDIITSQNLYGKKVKYTLGIPKGDSHKWEGKVIIWGDTYKIITAPTQGIEENIPLKWNKKVMVEDYEA